MYLDNYYTFVKINSKVKMRKILAVLLIYLSLLSYSQGQNRFASSLLDDGYSQSRSDEKRNHNQERPQVAPCNNQDVDCDDILDVDEENPGNPCGVHNPADPIPIDDYSSRHNCFRRTQEKKLLS
jgi:hypothetical protein